MKDTYKGTKLELKTRLSDVAFEDYDFSGTDFNSAILVNVEFRRCLFAQSVVNGTKVFPSSRFESCHFLHVDLRNTTMGSDRGTYLECSFERCDFRGKEFTFTEFLQCKFLESKLKRVSFNGSRFNECQFVGKLEDVSFNGLYDTNPDDSACLRYVDFSRATFGEFVNFYHCNLSSCVPPQGKDFEALLYRIFRSNPDVLSTGSRDGLILD